MASQTLPRPIEAEAPSLLRLVPSAAVLVGVVALFASVGGGLTADGGGFSERKAAEAGLERTAAGAPAVPKPESDPTALAPISPLSAFFANAALPVDEGPNPAAAAFTLPADEVARMRSIDCLTAAVYYESGLEPVDGQRAVAQVILNRVRHPHYPKTVCGVVFQGHTRSTGCQFTFTCDGSLRRTPAAHLWERSRRVAEEALGGYVHRAVGWATHYHANYVFPYWAPSLAKVATIGAHIFYRWDGAGRLTGRYAGVEPDIRWRGGFGQPGRAELAAAAVAAEAGTLEAREAIAAQAGAEAQKEQQREGTSFLRSVVRRYEPVNTQQVLTERAATQPATSSNRWAITGDSGSSTSQRPLGREGAEQPVVLEGVRRRPAPPTTNTTDAR